VANNKIKTGELAILIDLQRKGMQVIIPDAYPSGNSQQLSTNSSRLNGRHDLAEVLAQ